MKYIQVSDEFSFPPRKVGLYCTCFIIFVERKSTFLYFFLKRYMQNFCLLGTSLVVQWLRICLPMQIGTIIIIAATIIIITAACIQSFFVPGTLSRSLGVVSKVRVVISPFYR